MPVNNYPEIDFGSSGNPQSSGSGQALPAQNNYPEIYFGSQAANTSSNLNSLANTASNLPFPFNLAGQVLNSNSYPARAAKDVTAGAITGGLNLINLPHTLGAPVPQVLPGQNGNSLLNVSTSKLPDRLLQGVGSYIPTAGLMALAPEIGVLEAAGALADSGTLSNTILRGLTSQAGKEALGGGIYGSSNDQQHPLQGAVLGSISNLLPGAVGPVVQPVVSALENQFSKLAMPQMAKNVGSVLEDSRNITNQQVLDKVNQNYSLYNTNEKNAWENAKGVAAQQDYILGKFSSPGQNVGYDNSDYLNSINSKKQQLDEQSKNQPLVAASNQGAQNVLDQITNSQHSTFTDAIAHNQALNKAYGENLSPVTGVPKTDSEFDTIKYAISNLKSNIQDNINDKGLQNTLGTSLQAANDATAQKNSIFNEVPTSSGGSQRSLYNKQQLNQNPYTDPTSFVQQYVPKSTAEGTGKMQQFSQMVGDPQLAQDAIKRNLFQDSYSGSSDLGGENFDPNKFMTRYEKLSQDQKDFLFNPNDQKTISAFGKMNSKYPGALGAGGHSSLSNVLAAILGGAGAVGGFHEAGTTGGIAAGAASAAIPYMAQHIVSKPAVTNFITNRLTSTSNTNLLNSISSGLSKYINPVLRSTITPGVLNQFGGSF